MQDMGAADGGYVALEVVCALAGEERSNVKRRIGKGELEVDRRREERRERRVVGREEGWNSEGWKMGGELKDTTPYHSRCGGNPSPQLANNG